MKFTVFTEKKRTIFPGLTTLGTYLRINLDGGTYFKIDRKNKKNIY